MNHWILLLLAQIVNNPQLQEAIAEPIAKALVDVLPDVTEDGVADFLRYIADKLEEGN